MSTMVKTFRAADARAALAAVKAAMGPEAVILSTAQVPGGLFRKPEVEVTAALAPAEPAAAPSRVASRYQAGSAPPLQHSQTSDTGVVAEEMIALRSAFESMRTQLLAQPPVALREEQEPRFPKLVMQLFTHLVDRGIDPATAEELIRLASGARGVEPDHLWQSVRALLAERLVPCRAPWLKGQHRVMALIGPTGVGKTTTLAKIAARAVLESRITVAVITVDTYRIGASEQVARYGSIMNVPTRVAHNAKELVRALEFCAGAELVLIDTAGRSRAEEISTQAAMLRVVPGVQLALCLSAATGARELSAAAGRYAELKPERLIFTRLDESIGPGSVLSAAALICRPVACVTNGQRVPEDIHSPTGAQLVELVAGQWKPQT